MPTYHSSYTLLDASSSATTSPWAFVGDYRQLSVSVTTQAASVITLYGSDDDGFRAAIANSSVLTVFTGNGIFQITPGLRWMRAGQAASSSSATVFVTGLVG